MVQGELLLMAIAGSVLLGPPSLMQLSLQFRTPDWENKEHDSFCYLPKIVVLL